MYDKTFGISFSANQPMSSQFRNLKKRIKRHISLPGHLQGLLQKEAHEHEKAENKAENEEIGMNIGRILYKMNYNGRPDEDFEDELVVAFKNGTKIGDINHSVQFANKLKPSISSEIDTRLKKFLNNAMPQTKFRPAGKIGGDSSTTKHSSRMFGGFTTVIPNSGQVIQTGHIGRERLARHTGEAQAAALSKMADDLGIESSQYLGSFGDGHYAHCNVNKYLDKKFGFEDNPRPIDVDFMHKAGICDSKVRKQNSWVNQTSETLARAFRYVNIGNEYERYFEVCCNLKEDDCFEADLKFKNPMFDSETRFANYSHRVLQSGLEMFPVIVCSLSEAIEEKQDGDSKMQKSASEAGDILNLFHNLLFAFSLAGLTDVYKVLACGFAVLQEVNMLPHERLDKFTSVTLIPLKDMLRTLSNHSLCEVRVGFGKFCLWMNLHKEIESHDKSGKFRGTNGMGIEDKEYSKTRQGGKCSKMSKNASFKEKIQIQFSTFTEALLKKLTEEVFDQESRCFIAKIRPLTDLRQIAIRLKTEPEDDVFDDTKSCTEIMKDIASNLSDEGIELVHQWKVFILRISEVTKEIDLIRLESRSILQMFVNSELELFKDIENVIHGVCVAAVSVTVESIIESRISVYEFRNSKLRNISDERAKEEMNIRTNGPVIAKADSVIKNALTIYWGGDDWHFTRTSNKDVIKWNVSKVMDKKLKETSHYSSMDK